MGNEYMVLVRAMMLCSEKTGRRHMAEVRALWRPRSTAWLGVSRDPCGQSFALTVTYFS